MGVEVRVEGLTKAFGKQLIWGDVTLTLPATVRAASVVSASPTRVVVLLFVDQTTTSTRVTGPKVDQSRVRMTLVKSKGKWLVSGVGAL